MKRKLTFLQACVALFAGLLIAMPQAAHADAAQLMWAKEVTQLQPNHLLSQVDRDVSAGDCSSSGQLAVKDYPASGSSVVIDREIPAQGVNP